MEGAQDATADDAGEKGRRCDDRQQEADPGALADAALAELVGLDLALVIEDEDTERIELDVVIGLVPALHLLDGVVSGRLVVEERQYDCLCCHSFPPQGLVSRAGGARTTAVTRSWFAVRTSHTARRVVHPTPLGTGPPDRGMRHRSDRAHGATLAGYGVPMPSVRALAALAIATMLIGACASTGTAGTSAPTGSSVAASSPSAAVTESPAASLTPSASPSVDLTHPVGVIAIGHSGLTGEGTGPSSQAAPANSWATGTEPGIDSVYLRMVDALPETEGHVANTAMGGATAGMLPSQALVALKSVPAPALAIIQTVDNDILCDASNVAAVGASVADALKLIHDASPETKILVAGQLGRPSVSYVKELVAHDPSIKAGLTWNDPCTFYDASGKIHEAGFETLTKAIDAYEAETARVCAAVPNCVTDGGVRKAWIDKIDLFSPDYAHLNAKGQAAEAELIWPVVQRLLGL